MVRSAGEGTVSERVRQRRGIAPAAMVIAAALASPAGAAPPLLLLSHSAAESEDARNYAAYVARGLGSAAPLHGDRLARVIETTLSGSPGASVWPPELRPRVAAARGRFLEGEYVEAIAALERLRDEIAAVPALVASQSALRDLQFEVLIHLAYAYLRAEQGERARETSVELVRSFPDREISLAKYGPELARFIHGVRQAMQRWRSGGLHVSSEPRGCVIFVNERYAGVSPVHLAALAPGRYRIYAQRGEQQGRVHTVEVRSGIDHVLKIDFGLDSALRTTPFVGLRYPHVAALRAREARDAAAVGRALGVETVVLVGFRRHQGRRSLQGTVIAAGAGSVVRSAMVVLEPAPPPAALAALGRFLVAGEPASGEARVAVIVHQIGAAGEPADLEARARRGRSAGFAIGGVGIAALGVGVALLAIHGQGVDCPPTPGAVCRTTRNTLAAGAVTAGLGAAATTAGAILVYRYRASRVQLRAAGLGVALAGEF